MSERDVSAHLSPMTTDPTLPADHLNAPVIDEPEIPEGLTAGEADLVAAGILDLDTLRAQKDLEARYGVSGARFTAEQRALIDDISAEWFNLDALLLDAVIADQDVTDLRARFRYLAYTRAHMEQQATPVSIAALEDERLAALADETARDRYRATAKPWLHCDRWWEPGYVPDGAEGLDLLKDATDLPRPVRRARPIRGQASDQKTS